MLPNPIYTGIHQQLRQASKYPVYYFPFLSLIIIQRLRDAHAFRRLQNPISLLLPGVVVSSHHDNCQKTPHRC
jgi:hypothetical protein